MDDKERDVQKGWWVDRDEDGAYQMHVEEDKDTVHDLGYLLKIRSESPKDSGKKYFLTTCSDGCSRVQWDNRLRNLFDRTLFDQIKEKAPIQVFTSMSPPPSATLAKSHP